MDENKHSIENTWRILLFFAWDLCEQLNRYQIGVNLILERWSSLRAWPSNENIGWGHWLAKAPCCLDTWDVVKVSKMCRLTVHIWDFWTRKILLESPVLVKLGRGMYPNRVKGYFEQHLRLWVIKLLWWEEERKLEVCPRGYCSLQFFVRSLWANNSFGSFSLLEKIECGTHQCFISAVSAR